MPFAVVLSNVQDGMLGESTAIAGVKVVVGVVANKVIGCYGAGGKMLGHGRDPFGREKFGSISFASLLLLYRYIGYCQYTNSIVFQKMTQKTADTH